MYHLLILTTTALAGSMLVSGITIYRLIRRVNATEEALDRVRSATYELTTMAQDDIHDLQDTLKDADITLSRDHRDERFRKNNLTHDEAVAEFEAMVKNFQDMRESQGW